MQFKQISLLAALATQSSAWTLQGYSKNSGGDTSCDSGTLGIDEVINKSGTEPLDCFSTTGAKSIQSVQWNSDGDFFVCFYNSFGCPSDSALATFPEGDFGCQATGNINVSGIGSQIYFAVKASSDGGC
ncbi:hypothetical protein NQ176_g7558 [Zarea fungicola]|uniref:Uncharacterized protein n=1 Tax=Zarea fungicola TaxID=93591 RepID=A0ACC1MXZ3_9HYPO|nr:hypothetical protein NQ176_g7558 [Lecanicillium fungicola]